MAVARALEAEGRQSVDIGGRRLRRCARPDCTKTCPPGEQTCFDHIPPELLEEANANADEDMSEAVISAWSRRNARNDDEFPEVPARKDEPAREEREEEAKEMAKTNGENLVCPSCDRKFGHGPASRKWHAEHVAKCKGPLKTEGRIAAAAKTAPASRPRRPDPPRANGKRSAVPREQNEKKGRRARGQRAKLGRSGQRATLRARVGARTPQYGSTRDGGAGTAAHPISPAAFIEALKAERAKIDAAIAAVEALA